VDESEREPPRRRETRRGEGGEVTQWPRGVVGYVPSGPPDDVPSPDEDRTANRLKIAARLIGVVRSQGRPVDDLLADLRAAEATFASGDRAGGAALVDRLLARLDRASTAAAEGPPPRP
jgi:hypothetical protein